MNCRQARRVLAAHRELSNEQIDTPELESHLSECAECRQALDQFTMLGRRIRALPRIDAPPEAHERLLQALASEHAHYLQQTNAATAKPVPDFLVPYISRQEHKTRQKTQALAAFSTAQTGPLPVISLHAAPRRRRKAGFNQFGIIGLAAAFLMILMLGGLTSILILAGGRPVAIQPALINIQQSQVTANLYTTNTEYTHVVSGVADSDTVYYTAYDADNNWMLEKLDIKEQNQRQNSSILLPTPNKNPLIVLGSADGWVVWLQFDLPKVSVTKKISERTTSSTRTWSLHSLYLGDAPQLNPGVPRTLIKDTFVQSTVPAWVHTPIQGIWFLQDSLLVARLDAKGLSSIEQYQLKDGSSSKLATIDDTHVFTSPTANSNGTDIYWGEEWQDNEGTLHGNIWTQQTREALHGYGKYEPHPEARVFPFRKDETSFHPQVINNTLFLLSTDDSANADATSGSAGLTPVSPTATGKVTATATSSANTAQGDTTTPQIDSQIYGPQIDQLLSGKIIAIKLSDYTPLPLPPGMSDNVATLQGGSRFLLYQNSNGNVGIYDTLLGQALNVVSTVKNASFLSVNDETAVWIEKSSDETTSATKTTPAQSVKVNLFTLTTRKVTKVAK